MTGQLTAITRVLRLTRGDGSSSERHGSVLIGVVSVLLCAAVVVVIAITNSAGRPGPPTFVGVPRDAASRIEATNRHFVHIGARVRVVRLTRSCSVADSPHPSHVTRFDPRTAEAITVPQAGQGNTTIVVASRHGLTGVSFQVHGAAPTCLPATGVAAYQQ
jgi:hypothetical protein